MVVNGKTRPYLEVEPRRYRFRLLNGCNARFLALGLVEASSAQGGPPFWQIVTDGGLLDRPVEIDEGATSGMQKLLLAPAERADLIVDFAGFNGRTLPWSTSPTRHIHPAMRPTRRPTARSCSSGSI